ncbi:uncharacterized protein LOC127719466 isoform X1 [Mytilus californianus]|uniref:uncharacterized protein LOC127719466 isoform X1 n=1 Tax=Mytilus californianus TaxID=6549 RepID=UPI00224775D7|nr:uncharacterized protein LOC127719466 isoform X1 [Mytilus californianus]
MIVLWFYVVIQLTIIHGEYVERIIDGQLKRCIPFYNCPPGNEILPCIEEFTKEQCQPCYSNGSESPESKFVQPNYISSVDGTIDQLKCFKPLQQTNLRFARCTGHDQVYSKTLNKGAACISGQGCKCKLDACFYGDPCLCDNFSHKKSEKCRPDFHLDNSGKCVPCPPGYKKEAIGCGPCLRVPGNNTIIKPSPYPETTTASSAIQTYQPKPPVIETTTTTTTSTLATVIVSKPGPRGGGDNSTTPTIIGIVVGIILLVIIAVVICFLYKKKKFEKIKAMCHGNRRNVEDQVVVNHEEEMQPLNRNVNFNDLGPEQQDNINNIRHMDVIERNISHVSVTDKPENNNLARVDSECPSVRFNSGSTVSINRQLSNITVTDRINSTASESSPLIQEERLNSNSQCVNHANSVPDRQVFPHGEFIINRQGLNRSESVPQQVSCEEDGDMCINIGNSPVHSPTSQLLPSPTRYPYLDNGGGACIPLPDFDNIQSSSPVMNTELPNIAEFKRSLSKDSESSVDNINSTSPYSSIPEETGKEIQEEVTAESNPSTTMLEPPHMSDVRDYNDCHNLSHVTDIPQASDITNQIDSRLEQYNHTVTGVDEDSVCSIQRLPSEHEEETAKKNDLESNLDSGMASKLGDSDLSSKSDCS